MNRPAISTIIPTCNASRFLRDALDSVRAQVHGEIIVVDDASTDDVETVVREYDGVRCIRHETNRGPAASRNTGIRASTGDILAFLDADDWWSAGKTDRQMELLAADPALQAVTGHLVHVHQPSRPTDGTPLPILSIGATLFRREAFARVGLFDEGLRYGEDSEWFIKARDLGVPVLMDEMVVLHYRRHGANMTDARRSEEKAGDMFGVLRRSLARKRGAPNRDDPEANPTSATSTG